MCGIIGIHSNKKNTQIFYEIFEGLMCLQHRGQDSVGISNEYSVKKYNGLVKYAFQNENFTDLSCQNYMGHVRYGTNGLSNNIQPFYSIFPRRITLCHNGNITNTNELKETIFEKYHILIDTQSDSEIILTIFSCKLYELLNKETNIITDDKIHSTINYLHEVLEGSYNLLIIIKDYGIIGIRDKKGIRPLIYGKREDNYIVASESVALNLLDYKIIRDFIPGESIIFKNNINEPLFYYYQNSILSPCLFEYIYFARPDSIIDNINVNEARIKIGNLLGKLIKESWSHYKEIDYIIPVPDTSTTFANGIQEELNIPVREGFIKNRYIDRTFIMKNKNIIQQNIKRKLSGIENSFKDKNVLIVDDSIVRGNTSKHVIKMVKNYGCKKIYFASCSPIIKNTNNYGIYIPTQQELISYKRNEEEIRKELQVDYLIYNNLDKIITNLKQMNNNIKDFEISMFL